MKTKRLLAGPPRQRATASLLHILQISPVRPSFSSFARLPWCIEHRILSFPLGQIMPSSGEA